MRPPKLTTVSFILLFLFEFGITKTYAQKKNKQETITIEAIVLDKNTKAPLPFTNVLIKGTSLGTMTNEEGRFELTINKKHESSNVIFSFIGYENNSIPIKKFKDQKKEVYLSTASTSLDEIVVTAKNKYKELIDQAITLIPQNYVQQPVQLDIYYRELTKIDDNYTKFSDAAGQIYYTSYDNNFDHMLSNTNYMRFNRLEQTINEVPFPEPKEFIADTRDRAK